MEIDISSPPFGISSISQFVTNLQGSLPLLNIVVGVTRISSTYAEISEEETWEKSKGFEAENTTSPRSANLWGHRIRGIIEILGGGIVLLALEITAMVLSLVIKLVRFLLGLLCTCLFGIGVCAIAVIVTIAGVITGVVVSCLALLFRPSKVEIAEGEEEPSLVIHI